MKKKARPNKRIGASPVQSDHALNALDRDAGIGMIRARRTGFAMSEPALSRPADTLFELVP
ncbi:hypothetical protein [Bradyrhizobium sp. USDA 3364]